MRIIFGPPTDSTKSIFFKEELLQASLDKNAHTIYLVPSARKRIQILKTFAKNGGGFVPKVITFNGLIQMLYGQMELNFRKLTSQAARLLVFRLVKKYDPSAFLGIAVEIYRNIMELRQSGIQFTDLIAFPDTKTRRSALFHKIYKDYEAYLTKYGYQDAAGMILNVRDQLQSAMSTNELPFKKQWRRLVADGFMDFTNPQIEILKYLSSFLTTTFLWPGNPDNQQVYGSAIKLFQANFHPLEWEKNQAETTTANNLSMLADNVYTSQNNKIETGQNLRVIEAANLQNEVSRIAADIKHRFLEAQKTNKPFRLDNVCVTFPNLQDYAPCIRWIFSRFGIPHNISLQLPLDTSPIITLIRIILETADTFNRNALLELIRNPLIQMPKQLDSIEVVKRLDNLSLELKILGGKENWLNKLQEKCSDYKQNNFPEKAEELQNLHNGLTELSDILAPLTRPSSLAIFIEHLMQVLNHLHINDTPLLDKPNEHSMFSNLDYSEQSYQRLLSFINELKPVLHQTGSIKLKPEQCREMFFRLLENEGYYSSIQTDSRVQVLGLLETRGLSFNHIYFGGLTENVFPVREAMSIFFNRETWELLLDKTDFTAVYRAKTDMLHLLMQANETITLSWPEQEENSQLLRSLIVNDVLDRCSSPALVSLPTEPLNLTDDLIQKGAQITRPDPIEYPAGNQYRSMIIGAASELDRINNKSPFTGKLHSSYLINCILDNFGVNSEMSATQIETYLNCPMQFFFTYLCRLEELKEPTEEFEPTLRGQFVHQVLQKYYSNRIKEGKGRIVEHELPKELDIITSLAKTIFNKIADETVFTRKELMSFIGDPVSGYQGTAGEFLQMESGTTPDLSPWKLEWRFNQSNGNPLIFQLNNKEKLKIRGIIDRIDRAENQCAVYDYKTGKINAISDIKALTDSENTSLEDISNIQIGVYMCAARQLLHTEPIGGFHYQVSGKDGCNLKPYAFDGENKLFQELRSSKAKITQEKLLNLYKTIEKICLLVAGKIRGGEFLPTQSEKNCLYCPFDRLCRNQFLTTRDEQLR